MSEFARFGWNDRAAARVSMLEVEGEPARVVRVDGPTAHVVSASGEADVSLPQRFDRPLATGDFVVVAGERVVGVAEPWSLLQRSDPSGGSPQPIAANVDLVVAVCGGRSQTPFGKRTDPSRSASWHAPSGSIDPLWRG